MSNHHHSHGESDYPPGAAGPDNPPPSSDELSNDPQLSEPNASANSTPESPASAIRNSDNATGRLWSETIGESQGIFHKQNEVISKPPQTADDSMQQSDSPDESGSEEAMTDKGVGPAYSTKGNKAPTKQTEIDKNKKNNAVVDSPLKGNIYAALEVAEETDDEGESDFDAVQNNIDFLSKEAREGVQERVVSEQSYHQRNQFESLIGSTPPEVLEALLNETAYNDQLVSMDIENPYDLPGEVMMSSLMIEIEEILKTAGGSVTQASADWTLASKAYSDFRCGLTIPREEWLDSHSEEDEKLQAHLHAMETQYVSKLNQLVAVKGMKHVRIVLNKAHFPGISDHRNIRSWASGLGAAGANFVSPTSIRETVVNLLANQTIVSCEDGMSSFSLRRSMAKAGHWLHTIVEHNPMEEGENAADYYFNNFLTPVDHIAKWLQIPGKYGRMVSYFLIELGSTKLPPRKVTAGRVKEHFIYAQKNWLYRPDLIKSYTADIKYYEQCYAGNYPPNIKRARLNKIAHLSELEQQKKNLDATIIKLDAYPEHAYIPDRYEMTSHVKFNLQYCPLCNTTKHSFKDCRERGCNICDSRNHPDYRCPMKCTCRSGRIHAYEGCSHPRAGTKSKRKNASLHEMRAENAKIKAIFLQNLANRDTSNVEEVSTSSQQATQATSNPSTRVNESSANTVNPVSPTRPLNSNSMANSLPPSQEASQGGVHPQSVMDSSQAATATPMSSMDLSESFLQAHCPPQATTPRDVDPESESSMGDGSEPDIQSNDESMDDEQQLQGSGGSHTSGPQGDAPQPGSVVNSRWADTPAAVESHQL